jgi:hypothetical protein
MNRRAFLGAVALSAGGMGLAGCLGSGGNPIQIAAFDIVNSNGQAHTVDIEVLFDGDVVVDETYDLEDGESTGSVESGLPDDGGEFEITVDPSELDSETFVPGEQTGADCGTLTFELLRDQVLQEFEDDCE